jgi:hypothetical protein
MSSISPWLVFSFRGRKTLLEEGDPLSFRYKRKSGRELRERSSLSFPSSSRLHIEFRAFSLRIHSVSVNLCRHFLFFWVSFFSFFHSRHVLLCFLHNKAKESETYIQLSCCFSLCTFDSESLNKKGNQEKRVSVGIDSSRNLELVIQDRETCLYCHITQRHDLSFFSFIPESRGHSSKHTHSLSMQRHCVTSKISPPLTHAVTLFSWFLCHLEFLLKTVNKAAWQKRLSNFLVDFLGVSMKSC